MSKHGFPFKGDEEMQINWDHLYLILGLTAEIPNYLAMAFIGFLPCKRTLWSLSRRQVLASIAVGSADIIAQCMSKNGVALLPSTTAYMIINSSFSIIFTAVGSRFFLKKKFHVGQYIG